MDNLTDITRKILLKPNGWPHWPALPVKRIIEGHSGWPDFATVYWLPLFEDPTPDSTFQIMDKSIFEKFNEKKHTIRVISFEAILAEGWVVD
jgi:hypothetical protein